MKRLTRIIWRSAISRPTLFYSLLTLVVILTVLLIVHWGTSSLLNQRAEQKIEADMERILRNADDVSMKRAKREVERAVSRNKEAADTGVYLLIDERGRRIAGNLDRMPEAVTNEGLADAIISQSGQSVSVRYVSQSLQGGGTLLVGRNLSEQDDFARLLAYTSLFASIVALLLLAGGNYLFHRQIQHSTDEIRRIAERIAKGDLQERIVTSGGRDAFARLETDINEMLDRIQGLMLGVQHASNMIAHNLRTPFQHILVCLRNAQDEDVSDAQRCEAISVAIAKVENLCRVFDKLLGIAEAQAGIRRRQFSTLELSEVVNDVLELYEDACEGHGIELIAGQMQHALVLGDRDLLAMALSNLIENALKYAGKGATVRVSVVLNNDHAHLIVQDDGSGIPESERVIRHFHRLHADRPGHGLGLVYVDAVTSLHGGRLRLTDAGPGLRVCIDIPIVAIPAD